MTCEGASNVKAGVRLSHCVRHNGCSFWSVGTAMRRCLRAAKSCQAAVFAATIHAVQSTCFPASHVNSWLGGFFLMLCYWQFTVSVSLNFILCSAVRLWLFEFVPLVILLRVWLQFSVGFPAPTWLTVNVWCDNELLSLDYVFQRQSRSSSWHSFAILSLSSSIICIWVYSFTLTIYHWMRLFNVVSHLLIMFLGVLVTFIVIDF